MNELELFAGAGGGILGSMLLGHRTVCAVEYDAYARSVLLARQNDGTFPPFPVWDDVRTFDGKPWRGIVDVVSGGFPCQDISAAGKGAGITGERSGLWGEMARIIGEVRPQYVFVENSPMLVTRGLGTVLADLHEMGFDAEWGVISAADTGAPHRRERIWILANARGGRFVQSGIRKMEFEGRAEVISAGDVSDSDGKRTHRAGARSAGWDESADIRIDVANTDSLRELQPERNEQEQRGWPSNCGEELADTLCQHEQRKFTGKPDAEEREGSQRGSSGSCGDGFKQWPVEPGLDRVVNGMANRSHRLKAIGNGQVSRVRAAAWRILTA